MSSYVTNSCKRYNIQRIVLPDDNKSLTVLTPKLSVSHVYRFNITLNSLRMNLFQDVACETLRDCRSHRIYGVRSRPA